MKDLNGILLLDYMAKAERLIDYPSAVCTDVEGVLPHISNKVDVKTEINNVNFTPELLVYKRLRKPKEKTNSDFLLLCY